MDPVEAMLPILRQLGCTPRRDARRREHRAGPRRQQRFPLPAVPAPMTADPAGQKIALAELALDDPGPDPY